MQQEPSRVPRRTILRMKAEYFLRKWVCRVGVKLLRLGFKGTGSERVADAVLEPDGLLQRAAVGLAETHDQLIAPGVQPGISTECIHTLSIKQQRGLSDDVLHTIVASRLQPAFMPDVPYLQKLQASDRVATLGNLGISAIRATEYYPKDKDLGQAIRQQVVIVTGKVFECLPEDGMVKH